VKPTIIGITGGIGSGKTIVCKVFATLNIPVFYADDEAKKLYDTSPELLEKLVHLFGDDILTGGRLNKTKLADLVFQRDDLLKELNAMVHPLVGQSFATWHNQQSSPYVIREAAILLESGSYRDCDLIILVTADESLRIKRVMERSKISSGEVQKRMAKQWTDTDKRAFADFEINNDEKALIIPQIISIHESILRFTHAEI
jgi:dephospho-CoA kinase